MKRQYDLVILGSGSTAFAAALKAAEMGKTAVMTENRTVGGTCVNRGCLPSKNLIEASRIVWESRRPRYPGLQPHEMVFDFETLIRQKDEVVHEYRDKKYSSIVEDADKIEIVEGTAAFAGPHEVSVNGTALAGERVLIATGTRAAIPDVEGLADVPYLTSDLLSAEEGEELRELPRSLVIIGAGYIALELGQMFHRFGSSVTILERGDKILKRYEPEVSIAISGALTDEGVNIVVNAEPVRVFEDGGGVVVAATRNGVVEEFRGERLLVAAGRAPNTEMLNLASAGVLTDEGGFVAVDEELRTNVPHIWAAGDVIGSQTGSEMATPVGAHDGGIAAANALGGEARTVDHRVIPRTIFTDPQVAVVGLTDAEAIALGHRCWCNTVPVSLVPRAGAIRDTRGIAKMVIDADSGVVLGVSLVMREAGEVIHEAAMGIRMGATIDDFVEMLHVYPTMAEALKIVAISRYKDPAKLSCCAD